MRTGFIKLKVNSDLGHVDPKGSGEGDHFIRRSDACSDAALIVLHATSDAMNLASNRF